MTTRSKPDWEKPIVEQGKRLELSNCGEARLQLALLKRMYPEIDWSTLNEHQ